MRNTTLCKLHYSVIFYTSNGIFALRLWRHVFSENKLIITVDWLKQADRMLLFSIGYHRGEAGSVWGEGTVTTISGHKQWLLADSGSVIAGGLPVEDMRCNSCAVGDLLPTARRAAARCHRVVIVYLLIASLITLACVSLDNWSSQCQRWLFKLCLAFIDARAILINWVA